MRVFLDANFLVAAGFTPKGAYRKLLDAKVDFFVTSEHVLSEVARNLIRLNEDPAPFLAYVRGTVSITSDFDLLPSGLPLEGEGDRQALAEAIGSGCDMFVTSDTDFDALFGQRVKGVFVERSSNYRRSKSQS